MRSLIFLLILFVTSLLSGMAEAKTAPARHHEHLAPISWQGEKWEYLIEHPTDIRHIDPVRMEELTDQAGQHGWRLIEVTSENQFYAFYFSRPLLPHKLEAHRDRLNKLVARRKLREAELIKRIEKVHQEEVLLAERQKELKQKEAQEKREIALEKAHIDDLKYRLHQKGIGYERSKILKQQLWQLVQDERKLEADEQTLEKEEHAINEDILHDQQLEEKYKKALAKLIAEDATEGVR